MDAKNKQSKSESKIQAAILHYIRTSLSQTAWAIKVIVANERGCPDILMVHRGQFYAVEIKKEGQHLSAIQAAQFKRLNAVGAIAIVVHSLEEFKEMVK